MKKIGSLAIGLVVLLCALGTWAAPPVTLEKFPSGRIKSLSWQGGETGEWRVTWSSECSGEIVVQGTLGDCRREVLQGVPPYPAEGSPFFDLGSVLGSRESTEWKVYWLEFGTGNVPVPGRYRVAIFFNKRLHSWRALFSGIDGDGEPRLLLKRRGATLLLNRFDPCHEAWEVFEYRVRVEKNRLAVSYSAKPRST